MWVQFLGPEISLEEDMATHSIILAWRIPWTEEPGGLQSMGSQSVKHSWSDEVCLHTTYNMYCAGLGCSVVSDSVTLSVAMTSSRGYSSSKDRTCFFSCVSALQADSLSTEPLGKSAYNLVPIKLQWQLTFTYQILNNCHYE